MDDDVASGSSGQLERAADFEERFDDREFRMVRGFRRRRGRIEADIQFTDITAAVEVVDAVAVGVHARREIHALELLLEHLALFPAYHVVVTVPLGNQFDGPLAADFEDDALVLAADVRVTRHVAGEIRVRIGIGRLHVEVRHTHPVADRFDGFVDVVLGERSAFGLSLGEIQINLGRTEEDDVVVGLVVTVLAHVGHPLGQLVTGGRAREIGREPGSLADARVTRTAHGLRQPRITALHLLVKLHRAVSRNIRETAAVRFKVAVHDLLVQSRHAVGVGKRVVVGVVDDVQADLVVAGQDHLRGNGVVRREEVPVRSRRTLVDQIRAFVDEPFGCLDTFVQVLFMAGYAVVFAECAFEEADPRFEGECGPLRDAVNVLLLR